MVAVGAAWRAVSWANRSLEIAAAMVVLLVWGVLAR